MAPCAALLSLLGAVGAKTAGKHSSPRFAVVLTLALNSSASMPSRLIQGQLCRLRGVVASLRNVGYRGDIVCQTAGLLALGASTRTVLRSSCTQVLALSVPAYDAGPSTKELNDTQAWYREHGRVPPPDGTELQDRHDGALTSVKLHAWNLTRYRMVLHSDMLRLDWPRGPKAASRLGWSEHHSLPSDTLRPKGRAFATLRCDRCLASAGR